MSGDHFQEKLFEFQDLKYRDFHSKLIPNVPKETIIGVRVPAMRGLAKKWMKERREECLEFLDALPHEYYDENLLHAFLIENIKDMEEVFRQTERFLPYIDNWAVCDSFSPKIFKKHPDELLKYVVLWLDAEETYTVRYGIGMLLQYFLEEEFQPVFLKQVAEIQTEEYYIQMMQAWYFCEALIKQWEKTLPYFENRKLETWTHNKAIQKATESFRLTKEQKEVLKKMKISSKTRS